MPKEVPLQRFCKRQSKKKKKWFLINPVNQHPDNRHFTVLYCKITCECTKYFLRNGNEFEDILQFFNIIVDNNNHLIRK